MFYLIFFDCDIRLLSKSKVGFVYLYRFPFFKQNILTQCRNLRILPTNIELVVEEGQSLICLETGRDPCIQTNPRRIFIKPHTILHKRLAIIVS